MPRATWRCDGLDHARVAVAEQQRAGAEHVVDVLAAVDVPHARARAACEHAPLAAGERELRDGAAGDGGVGAGQEVVRARRHRHAETVAPAGTCATLAAMLALRVHEFGGPEVLRVEEIPDPEPGPAEVVLRVHAAALNHLDVDMRRGVSRFPVPVPHTPGFEVVGRVQSIGEGVTNWAPGDRALCFFASTCRRCRFCRTGREALCADLRFVSVAIPGGMSELFRCPADQLLRVPDELDDASAAAVMAAFGTSYHMLFTRAGLRAGERVLISSVGSGIGSAAVQLAKWAGAEVIGTASSAGKLERARALGLDHGIDYTSTDVVAEVLRLTDGEGVELAYEHVGGERFGEALGAIGKDGRVVTCGAHAGEVVDFDIIPFFRGQKTVIGSFCYTREEVATCLELAARGVVEPQVFATFALADARAAYELMEERRHFGKIVVTPG